MNKCSLLGVFGISELLFLVSFHRLHRTDGDVGRCRALAVMSPPFLEQRNCCMVKLNFDISRLSIELSLAVDWLFIIFLKLEKEVVAISFLFESSESFR